MPNRTKPLEQKRLSGRSDTQDSSGRPLPSSASTIALRPSMGVPDPPDDLGDAGMQLWNRSWGAASGWISQDTDRMALERACRLADVEKLLYRHVMANPTGRGLATRYVEVTHALGQALSALGFDPSARSRLGVAEVKAKSKLEEMKLKREAAGKSSE